MTTVRTAPTNKDAGRARASAGRSLSTVLRPGPRVKRISTPRFRSIVDSLDPAGAA